MSSIDRLHKFAELLCRAIPDLDIESLSPRPLDDPASHMHVGRIRTRGGEPGVMRVLFAVSEFCNFVPLAFTTCEDTEVALSLVTAIGFVGNGPVPPVGATFDLTDARTLSEMGVVGCMLLKPQMLDSLSGFEDGIANGDEVFDPRLMIYLNAADLAAALAEFPALLNRFDASGQSVFLSRDSFRR